jgi:hypothetical protein
MVIAEARLDLSLVGLEEHHECRQTRIPARLSAERVDATFLLAET